jgi:hypothetical protein
MSNSTAIEVRGRNGHDYDAYPVGGAAADNLYIVGIWVVTVWEGKVRSTVCRASKKNLKELREGGWK